MKPDPLDELGARLFEAARRDSPPPDAVQRAIQAARRETAAPRRSAGVWWLAVAPLAAGVAAAAVWLSQPADPSHPISAEPSAAIRTAPEAPRKPAVIAVPAVPSVVAPLPGAKPVPPVSSAPMTLADELEALKRAQSALDSGDSRRALELLNRYDRAAKGQRLRAEATVLRIEALSRSGQQGAAAELARRFVEQNPESPLVDRARSFAGKDVSAAGGQPQKEAAGGRPQKEE